MGEIVAEVVAVTETVVDDGSLEVVLEPIVDMTGGGVVMVEV